MKHRMQKILMLTIGLFTSINVLAHDFKVDGIYYDIIDLENLTCGATNGLYTGDIIIPETVTYRNRQFTVISLLEGAFAHDTIQSLTIPNTITKIQRKAFEDGDIALQKNCTIYKIIIADGENILDIELNAFEKMKTAEVYCGRNLTETYAQLFPPRFIKKVTLGGSVTTIGDYAFNECWSIDTITISNSTTIIGNSAFSHCSNLRSIEIPNSVTTIGKAAFQYTSIPSVTIGESITTIEDYTFRGCDDLKSLTIGSATTKIGDDAFYKCDALNVINSLNPIPPTLSSPFENKVYIDATLNVPIGAGEAYKSADGWKNFWNIQEVDFASVGNIETNKTKVIGDSGKIIVTGIDNTKVEIFNTSGQLIYSGTDTTINVPTKGIYIVRIGGKTFKVSI